MGSSVLAGGWALAWPGQGAWVAIELLLWWRVPSFAVSQFMRLGRRLFYLEIAVPEDLSLPGQLRPSCAPVLGETLACPLLLGFAGPSGCGKSTAATLLVGLGGWRRVSFADPLREALLALHPGWDLWHVGPGKDLPPGDGGFSPREMMRALGDWAKRYYPSFFVDAALLAIDRGWRDGLHVVIDDVRFPAEAEAIAALGGAVCHVSRQDVQFARDHNSEVGIAPRDDDFHLRNWGGIQDLRAEMNYVLSGLVCRHRSNGCPSRDGRWRHLPSSLSDHGLILS